jgi:hypothetical protein
VTPVDTRMEALNGVVFRTAKQNVEDDQRTRDVAALREEIEQLKAEQAQARADRKAKLQAQIDNLNAKLQYKLDQAKERSERIKSETETKVQALQKKAAKVQGDAKAAINTRVARIPPLTEREKEMLERIERLERRLAAIEAASISTDASGTQPQSAQLAPGPPQLGVGNTAETRPLVASLNSVAAMPTKALSPERSQAPSTVQTPTQQQSGGKSGPVATRPMPVAPPEHRLPDSLQALEAAPSVDNQTPFAFGDFSWLNGSPRTKETVLNTKFFTPEIRLDTHYMEDFNQPLDHTIVGSTESFRSGEVQIEQASVGGDFHWQNVRGRILFMEGLFATTTPRNDASSATFSGIGNTGGVGQWDLQNAYKYVSEAYGGYHFDVQHGLNVDAGIFVSYIGLFSYYNFDNWTYQPSYVSSNTPWFFNGVRVQWYPTNKLKIEPWFINGWQSYARFNGHPGLGGQLLWMPKEWFKLVANQYGYGQDNLGLPKTQRIHTDDSIEVRYYNNPENLGLSKMAFSLTGDAGCQYGGGITCHGGPNKSAFLGCCITACGSTRTFSPSPWAVAK